MTLTQMHERLREELQNRLDKGHASVSSIARKTNYGQSHISGFLHSKRRLSLEAVDRVLQALDMQAEDLIRVQPRIQPKSTGDIPVVTREAALLDARIRPSAVKGVLQVPWEMLTALESRTTSARRTWERFVAVNINAEDAECMAGTMPAGSPVLIDRHYTSLHPYSAERRTLYAVNHQGKLKLRYLERHGDRVVLRPQSLHCPLEVVAADASPAGSGLVAGRVALALTLL